MRLGRALDVLRVPVGLRIDGDGADAQLVEGSDDTDGDLATIGDQDLGEHAAGESIRLSRLSRVRPPSVTAAVVRFLAGSLLAIAVVLVGGFIVLRQVTIKEAERRTRDDVQLEARLIQAAGLTDGVLTGKKRALRRLDDAVVGQLTRPSLVRVKVWTRDGKILYSDEPRLIGQRFPLGDEERELFSEGGADAELSDLDKPENRYERQEGKLLEAHTVVRTPNGTPVLFETYQRFSLGQRQRDAAAEGDRAAAAGRASWSCCSSRSRSPSRSPGGSTAATPSGRSCSSPPSTPPTPSAAGSPPTCTTAWSRTSPASPSGSAPGDDARRSTTRSASLRQGVRDLRTLLVQIHPPSLASAGLESALHDLLSPLAAAGLETSLEVDDGAVSGSSHDALVYRVAREALRNVAEHAEAHARGRLGDLRPARCGSRSRDDGRGFDPAERERRGEEGHVGLTLLDGPGPPGRRNSCP